jgi:hypothetical protein
MTPLTALPIPTGTALPAEVAGGSRGQGAEVADFSALLALQPGGTAAAPQDVAATAPGAEEAYADPSSPAILPLPGKILPPALPDGAPMPDAAEAPAPTETPAPAVQHIVALTNVALRTLRTTGLPVTDEPNADDETPVEPDHASAHSPFDLPQPAALPVLQPASPVQALFAVEPAADAPAESPTITPSASEPARRAAPSLPAPIRAQAQAAPSPVPAPQPLPPAGTLLSAATLPAQPVAATLTLRPGRPVEVARRPVPSTAVPTEPEALLSPSEAASPHAPIVAGEPAPVPASAPSLPASEPASRPHDFAALVDRLTAAREAMQPQSMSIAVAHRDFGPVRLQFRQEDGALSVALANADPDFARAVAAAPPVQSPASSEAGSFQPGRSDGGDSSGSSSGQSRSGTNTAAREDRTPQANPSSARAPRRGGDRQQGIFA